MYMGEAGVVEACVQKWQQTVIQIHKVSWNVTKKATAAGEAIQNNV